MTTTKLPDLVPVLSSGRHRNPRKGACFMEMASFLAGERWSDHPRCTHPLLAALARMVNDSVPNGARSRLVPLIPDVVGMVGDDLVIDLAISAKAAAAALPIAAMERQNALAVGLLTCDRMLADVPTAQARALRLEIATALREAPQAHAWASRFGPPDRVSERTFRRQTGPHIVAYGVQGIAAACVSDAPDRLVALLSECIDATAELTTPAPAPAGPATGPDLRGSAPHQPTRPVQGVQPVGR